MLVVDDCTGSYTALDQLFYRLVVDEHHVYTVLSFIPLPVIPLPRLNLVARIGLHIGAIAPISP